MQDKHTKIQNIQFFSICLFFASLNFEMFSPIVKNFSVAKMAAILYLGVSLLTARNLFNLKDIKSPVYCALIMFFLMVLSSIIHMDINVSIFDSSLLLNIIMFWFLLNHYRRDERIFKEGLLWFAVSSFVISVFYFFNIGVSISEDLRVVVFGENANTLGVKMASGALILLDYCLNHSSQKPIYRPWLLLMAVPILSLMLATASRVSLLIFGLGAVLFVLLRPSKRRWTRFLWLIIGVVGLIIAYQIVLSEDVLMARMEQTIDDGNLSKRDYIWIKYLELIEQNPILGVGFTGADQYSMEVFQMARSPHNVFIEVALYSGILGLVWFVAFFFSIMHDAWLYVKKRKVLGPLILSIAIIGMVMSGQALNIKLFWVLAAYAISYRVMPYYRNNTLTDGVNMN